MVLEILLQKVQVLLGEIINLPSKILTNKNDHLWNEWMAQYQETSLLLIHKINLWKVFLTKKQPDKRKKQPKVLLIILVPHQLGQV